ncbi:hypothetical protein [Agrobacterium tumefaciens]|uniref:hypothetical protein n=1 Tax=Agrobacterium tumefaciens TaxID=358 RepID=UPI00046F3C40
MRGLICRCFGHRFDWANVYLRQFECGRCGAVIPRPGYRARQIDDVLYAAEKRSKPVVCRDENHNLVYLKQNSYEAGRIYNRAAQAGYLTRLKGDVQQMSEGIARKSRDSREFLISCRKLRDQTMSAIPEQIRPQVSELFEEEKNRLRKRFDDGEPA